MKLVSLNAKTIVEILNITQIQQLNKSNLDFANPKEPITST